MLQLKRLWLAICMVGATGYSTAQQAKLTTKWTAEAKKATVPLNQYPRPQLQRADWLCLNGDWDYIGGKNAPKAYLPNKAISFDKATEHIKVPFSPESYLSGIERNHEKNMWYHRTFTIPANWKGKHILLHLDAVDHHATVFVNKQKVGSHDGSYDAFSFDITKQLKKGENTITIAVQDLNDGRTPCGKCGPRGGSYTNSSGIWQTVWLEPVEQTYISAIKLTPHVKDHTLEVLVTTNMDANVTAEVFQGNKSVAVQKSAAGNTFFIPIKNPELWSPEHPFLYDLKLTLTNTKGQKTDQVSSYFGMREIRLQKLNGTIRTFLNGKFVMQLGLLDQGYWPDGVLTAPTDEALKFDVAFTKKAGFNLIRKHMKTEPQRFYYWADKLGVLVWQDMPAIWFQEEDDAPAVRSNFRKEWKAIIDDHYNSPSIVTWVPFNENWGAFEVKEITDWVKKYDPSRLVNGNSGFNNNPSYQKAYGDPGNGDFVDTHIYIGPKGASIPDSTRAASLGEFGGVGLYVLNHMWPVLTHAYDFEPTKNALTDRYCFLLTQVDQLMRYKGLSIAIYTQTTDVEDEINGLLTYDREIEKMDIDRVKKMNEFVIKDSELMNAETQKQ
ncbi:glycoside hydrolase family 2 protein [Zhouia sp. PK063]|uniref:glycoside hydrolase family 2 protein n=1 Tax=Zhouia sp. PK063 TaxID=3373602 RepID=UPI0037A12A9F